MKILAAYKMMTIVSVLSLAPPATAAVVWLVSDNGADLTMATSGSLNNGGRTALPPRATSPGGTIYPNSTEWWITNTGNLYFAADAGHLTGANPWLLGFKEPTSVAGETFGYMGTHLFWTGSEGQSPAMITPESTMVFQGQTVATAFGSNLDAGPVVLWTHSTTGDTISVALVPEPSSAVLFSLVSLVWIIRRRR